MNKEKIKEIIRTAVKEFSDNDRDELLRVRIYEPTISHKIAVYLDGKFGDYNVDCEYNRMGEESKRNSKGKTVRPDIIVHKRGKKDNLVVIEVKHAGKNSKKAKADVKKLKTYFYDTLDYKLGVFIGVLKSKIDICWIEKNGDRFKEEWEEL
ncbi:hypothetical protein SU69_02105 [Thermosipho melanesiensis]|uniref:Type I restriction enzyme R protein N-terminal domain-containing protein n=2 Tax=Thermosipho melanesiensis TaxID=46541 RepID=A6LK22_THEM4|nr:hypothetical protein [Thermosipho melanesiensis]ABR30273.1 hypothetical protein Tmel_0404 [Thermosipho melanesiensis BI429]APT74815.1 hypothetical protein BW47_02195 [Thermosipho melanesiensis]OOC37398.1 hypothetical protein SU68_02115 [Thermosipho melanesiensis]OOC39760.1 hypothetical protein SU69_02105 [Thermosipho melanesiensis]OOC39865.1 hypothetical protein SU70_02100 [Thermosipho melanesiensis]